MRDGKRLSLILRARKAARRHLDTCDVPGVEGPGEDGEILVCDVCVEALHALESTDAIVEEAGLSPTRGTTVRGREPDY